MKLDRIIKSYRIGYDLSESNFYICKSGQNHVVRQEKVTFYVQICSFINIKKRRKTTCQIKEKYYLYVDRSNFVKKILDINKQFMHRTHMQQLIFFTTFVCKQFQYLFYIIMYLFSVKKIINEFMEYFFINKFLKNPFSCSLQQRNLSS